MFVVVYVFVVVGNVDMFCMFVGNDGRKKR